MTYPQQPFRMDWKAAWIVVSFILAGEFALAWALFAVWSNGITPTRGEALRDQLLVLLVLSPVMTFAVLDLAAQAWLSRRTIRRAVSEPASGPAEDADGDAPTCHLHQPPYK